MGIFVVVGIIFFAILFRMQIADLLGGIIDYTIAGLQAAWPILKWILAGGVVLWLVSVFVISQIGDYANSGIAIWFFVILLPIWLGMLLMKNPIAKVAGFVSGFAVLVAGGFLIFGLFSPEIKESSGELAEAKKAETAVSISGEALQSRGTAEAGTIRHIKSNNTPVFGRDGVVQDYYDAKTPVKLLDGGKTVRFGNSELLVRAIFQYNGRFIGGNIHYVALSDLEV